MQIRGWYSTRQRWEAWISRELLGGAGSGRERDGNTGEGDVMVSGAAATYSARCHGVMGVMFIAELGGDAV